MGLPAQDRYGLHWPPSSWYIHTLKIWGLIVIIVIIGLYGKEDMVIIGYNKEKVQKNLKEKKTNKR